VAVAVAAGKDTPFSPGVDDPVISPDPDDAA
jgi:hypothetical protein